jgi:multidrug efflux pump subunit AcrB
MAKGITGGVKGLLQRILDLNIHITKRYTNPRYYEEIKGIAQGSGGKIRVKDIARINMIPELIKAACTIAGVWGPASK